MIAGRYRVEEQLASGGMGAVHRVLDLVTGREVALKRLLATSERRELVQALFEREFSVLRSLRHPRIIQVYDYGVHEGEPYYTMEVLHGSDLGRLAPMPYALVAGYMRDVALSLALLETRKLVHRDVSPRNIRVTQDGRCKLLDFGALASFGASSQVVGTPPCVPPEAIRGAPLDQRSDLYSLGATAYYALTGRHAYPARSIHQLNALWCEVVPPPSHHVPGIPPALDTLVLSLLHHDPLARPQSAAEVIDRLSALLELPSHAEPEVAMSYFFGTALVAREQELPRIQAAVEGVIAGRGASLLLQGPSGSGRSRLLAEACLRAQLAGASVVQVDAALERQPDGALLALVERLIEAGAPEVLEAARPHAVVLAALTPRAKAVLGLQQSVPVSDMPGEWRSRVQAAVRDWLVAISRELPLVVAFDNLELADDGSAALLASLAASAPGQPLLVVATLRSDGPGPLSSGAAYVRSAADSITLEPFTPPQTLELARAMFGDVTNVMRLGEWLQRVSGGIVGHCFELASELRRLGSIHFAGGTWILPDEAEVAALPDALAQALRARIAGLSPRARALAEALAVHAAALDLAACSAVALAIGVDDGFTALQELVACGVLAPSGDRYAFCQDTLRLRILDDLSPAQRRRVHAQLAQTLLTTMPRDDLLARVAAGWHLLRAGDELMGARLLARSALAFETGSGSLQAAVPALEEARLVFIREGCSAYELLPLVARLATEGYFSDRRLSIRYADEAFRLLGHAVGLDVTKRLSPWLGRRVAVSLGLAAGALRYHAAPKSHRPVDFNEVFVLLVNCVTTQTAAAAVCHDPDAASKAVRFIEPLTVLGKDHLLGAVHEYCVRLMQMCLECEHEACEGFVKLLARFEDPRQLTALPHYARQLYLSGALFALGISATWHDGPEALERANQLEALGLRIYERAAQQVRMLYYASRADMKRAEHHRSEMELHAIQTGSAWQIEVTVPVTSAIVYGVLGDVQGLSEASSRCEQLAERYQVPSLRRTARSTRATYLLWRGSTQAAIDILQEILAEAPVRGFIGWARTTALLADAYNRVGRHQDALDTCLAAMRHCVPADRRFVRMFLGLDLQLALAEVGLGRATEAVQRLQSLLVEHAAGQNPLTLGLIHEALTEVAITARDAGLFLEHAAMLDRLFRATGVASLVARTERLTRRGTELFGLPVGLNAARDAVEEASLISAVSQGKDEDTRCMRALELVLARAQASAGHLFIIGPDGVRQAASSGVSEPQLLSEARTLAQSFADQTTAGAEAENATQTVAASELQSVYEWHPLRRSRKLVGLLALKRQAAPHALGETFLHGIANSLEL